MKKSTVIVVPIYKKELSTFENISLTQLFRVLDNYAVCFIMPMTLETSFEGISPRRYKIERFSDSYFKNQESYSRLCLSTEFYERFEDYEYILIHQIDAFVFSDRLMEFVDMGYDYIGAPMKNEHWKDYHVGNGGLSLRNIKKTCAVVRDKERIVKDKALWDIFNRYEDTFFGYCANRKDVDYVAAPVDIANRFSIDEDHCCGFRMMNEYGLPFGTHRWMQGAYTFWKPVIEAYGYNLPSIEQIPFSDMLEGDRYERIFDYIPKWYEEVNNETKKSFLVYCGLDVKRKYIIWGAGYHGKRCVRALTEMGLTINLIIDNAACTGDTFLQIPIFSPNDKEITEALSNENSEPNEIVIAAYGKETEIAKQIQNYPFNGFLCTSWFDILEKMIDFVEREAPSIEGITVPFTIEIAGGVNGHRIRYPYR